MFRRSTHADTTEAWVWDMYLLVQHLEIGHVEWKKKNLEVKVEEEQGSSTIVFALQEEEEDMRCCNLSSKER